MLKILTDFLQVLGPTLVGILTVPLFGLIKKLITALDGLPAWTQQILAVVIAGGLTALGSALQVTLPTDLHLFASPDVSALISGAIALAVHAGSKAKTPTP